MTRWTLLDVYGRLWMAPRAGFEIDRKLMSAQIVLRVEELHTPSDTPLVSRLRERRAQ